MISTDLKPYSMRPGHLDDEHVSTKRVSFWLIVMTALCIAGHGSSVSAENCAKLQGAWSAYRNPALHVAPTTDGALLHCEFQKLDGHSTAEGLWLTSTASSYGLPFRLKATSAARQGEMAPPTPKVGTVSVQ